MHAETGVTSGERKIERAPSHATSTGVAVPEVWAPKREIRELEAESHEKK